MAESAPTARTGAGDTRATPELPQGLPVRLAENDDCGIWEDGSIWCFRSCEPDAVCYPERLDVPRPPPGTTVVDVHNWGNCVLLDNGELLFRRGVERRATFCRPGALGRYELRDFQYGFPESCALTLDGRALCWRVPPSAAWEKQPTLVDKTAPRQVLDGVTQLDGLGTFCAVRKDGSVWCWGENGSGELGERPGGSWRASARPVHGLPPAKEVAVGSSHVCALTLAGEVYCWGSNTSGELGIGKLPYPGHDPREEAKNPHEHPKPQRVVGLSNGIDLMVSGGTSCVLDANGAIHCWGEYGGTSQPKPVQVAVPPAAQLVRSRSAACLLTKDRRTFCWGGTGSGMRAASEQPVEVHWQGMPPLR